MQKGSFLGLEKYWLISNFEFQTKNLGKFLVQPPTQNVGGSKDKNKVWN